MSTQSSTIVQRLWNYCNVLRDDRMSYGDYVGQLTYLLFQKMDDEQMLPGKDSATPAPYNWRSLLARDKVSLDIFWLRDESLEDSAHLPEPDVLAAEIVEELQAALEQFAAIEAELGG